ncbi:MAG: DNA repair protein RecN [Deltaproteobacteria bacterium]|nr:DNA repair protein RecN [Deltaproteobacteria bacterium]
MLLELTVRRLAIIDDVTVTLSGGLNVLTGETGAGKSILVGALQLALGERASADAIRHGAETAEVEAIFDVGDMEALRAELAEEELLDGRLLMVRRVLSANGRHRVFIGGRSMPLARLAEIGERLVSIYGQHESRGLLRPETHLEILDAAAGLTKDTEAHAELFASVQALRRELSALEKRQADAAAREDYLRFVLDEIDEAELSPGEEDELVDRRRVMAASEKLAAIAEQIASAVYEDDGSIAEAAGNLSRRAEEAAGIDKNFREVADAVESLVVTAEEVGRSARSYRESLELDPEELERLDARLDLIRKLTKKYGGSVDAVLKTADDARAELGGLSDLGSDIKRVSKDLAAQSDALIAADKALEAARDKAAKAIAKSVSAELADLGMPKAQFAADFSPVPEGAGMDVDGVRLEGTGARRVEFLFSANPGEKPRQLARIASGGELSRIMLAIKNSMTKVADVPTLVFDEVDTGIGGAQAAIVGRKLAQVADRHQVLCITHLAQIAGMADRHMRVEKTVAKGRTATQVHELDDAAREQELARMMSGEVVTDASKAAAREMMKA